MKEWPTRSRTGMPPCSRMYSAHGARRAQVVDDRLARLAIEQLAGDERGREVAADRLAALVDEGGAVGVAVEGDAEVGAVSRAPPAQVASGSRA